ncbi:porin family protein [Bradyrhizobium sp. U87765 SZCCT0131]|uniref:outer membrane protein n=1 Tax=unclassified Bradyrhizobium TaxID=2631580 RepID=UPI001BA61153|nr:MULTISPECIES: outer membrane beta-barrel protein [unclassified Bradyrhizobium]MBR1219141.1 porin family protein [Bradyrhizobium sp. U87765 SZCCT0131]MBR1261792.1 porin family protein [Bradyrhizobium sp. U87765 SZCCT0134]MBR1306355.1 porin family protein [Bradyrhizobium sp. U87765 SZCCT0110]MBR1317574.1 porin family protein [Bradyrhizobium sp. U87765 SZCCT0109]MBR1351276.1 porin family protein [Bradyrhizobium sp. U87765 SZCCT0048]
MKAVTSTRIVGSVFALAGAAFAAGSASAADLPAKVYRKAPPMVVQAYNWTGFYAGVNAGVGFGRSTTQAAIGAPPVGFPTSRLGGLGGFGGGQIGYNWQYGDLLGLGNIVLGVETDIQGGSLKDSRTCEVTCLNGTGLAFNQKLDWFGTARGRIGLATGSVLTYFTGGFAYGNVKTTVTDLSNPALATTFGSTRTGWTVGSGVEAALGGNWTGKIEYLYVDLGTQNGAALLPNAYAYSSQIREHIFRVGLNYRIGGVGLYAPEPVANWSGVYLGGNVGGATALNRSTLAATALTNEKFNLAPDGYLGGVQIGYNWQAGAWVYGLETDIQGSSQKDDKPCQLGCFLGIPQLATFNQKMQWFGTARGRIGYSVGSTLFYATGGFAYGNVKTDVAGSFLGTAFAQSFSRTRTGYAVGGGIESPFDIFGLFGKNWTSKTEYLYVDLGRSTDVITGTGLTFSTKAQEHVFRTGLNYHFNSPVVARY